MTTGNRILYLDIVKLFTIYLVILGHVIAMMKNGYVVGERLYSLIYSFHMPLFILLSGYFVSSKFNKTPLISIIAKKAKQLILPAITCAVICLLYQFIVRDNVAIGAEIIGNSWFLKTLFVYYIFFSLLKRLPFNDWILCMASCMLLFIIPKCSFLQINLLFPYFWGGYMMRKYNILEKISFSWKFALLFIVLFVVLYSIQRYWGIPNYIEINVHSLQSKLHLILFRYLVAFSGCLAAILLISTIYKRCEKNEITSKCAKYGQWTLGVYLLQTILVVNIFPDTIAWYVKSEWLLDLIIAPLLSLVFLIVCLYLIYLISKNKTLDFLFFGGQYNKSK